MKLILAAAACDVPTGSEVSHLLGDNGGGGGGSGGDGGVKQGTPDASEGSGADEPTAPPPPPPWSEDAGASSTAPVDGGTPSHDKYASSKTCSGCHATIYKQWSQSMHSRGLIDPMTVAQTNQVVAGPLANSGKPDPQRLCVNCHGPTAAAVTTSSTLPFDATSHADEGVSCTGCHQFNGNPTSGGGGISTSYIAGLVDGNTYYGPITDPATPGVHQAAAGIAFQQKNLTCANCHNVSLDLNHDGKIVKGTDLVLQQTFDEYSDYRNAGGTQTCTTCHMPILAGVTKAADGSNIVAPDRQVHDHSFVGTDYGLDDPTQELSQRTAREALLQSAAVLTVDQSTISKTNGLTFAVTIENAKSGHNLPTGFGFARQMWLEVTVTTNGVTAYSSGVLANPTDDLCDASTLDETGNPLAQFIVGCSRGSDKDLVNLQTKLVDRVTDKLDANGNPVLDQDGQPVLAQDVRGKEAFLQFLRGGPVARVRPSDNTVLAPLQPFERRSFTYKTGVIVSGNVNVSVRLLFRHLPPYFIRALGKGQPATETQVASLIPNLRIVEMGAINVNVQ